jgi:protein-S-isoprenylcysteine O-methyltransferase Ste14
VQPIDTKDHPGVIAFPPLILLVGAVVSAFVHFMFPGRMMMRHALSLLLGIAVVVTAFALMLWAILIMKMAGTNVHPNQPALTIARNGPYRFTRNPMYLGLCLLQVALSFFFNDWASLLFVIPLAFVLHYGVILREEKYLEAKFGDQYLPLKRDVRRWI